MFKKRKKFQCLCCGCFTLDDRNGFDICPVCYWEDDGLLTISKNDIYMMTDDNVTYDSLDEKFLNIPSGANHGLTLREGRENYQKIGACEESMIEYVRKPKKRELPNSGDRRKSERSS